jgi:multidrug transporter EmrE-like cation transporter
MGEVYIQGVRASARRSRVRLRRRRQAWGIIYRAMQKYFLFFILGAVMLEALADVLFKYWSLNGKSVLFGAGLVFYTIGTLIWAYSIKLDYLARAISVFTVLNMVAIVLVAFVLFKEELSLVNKLGVALGIVSVILMQI